MPIFLNPDQISFWLIVFSISLIWWLRKLWSPLFNRVIRLVKHDLTKEDEDETAGIEILYRQELFQLAQADHLSSDLFPLSEITIRPKIQVPTPDYDPENPISHLPITNEIIPYMPDMAGLGAFYNSPTITIEEAIETGLNIGLIGESGSGKTHTLNYLAVELSQKKPELGSFSELLPILINASDMNSNTSDIIKTLTKPWEKNHSVLNAKELYGLFEQNLVNRNVLLLVDGLDEAAGSQFETFLNFLIEFRQDYPGNKMIVNLSPNNNSALEPLNLYPLSLAYWNENDLIDFSSKWNSAWENAKKSHNGLNSAFSQSSEFISRKLIFEKCLGLSPFEITLKIWNLYLGKLSGTRHIDHLETYIQNQTHKLKKTNEALESIAFELTGKKTTILELNNFDFTAKNLIPALINRGVLQKRLNNQIKFTHQKVFAYYAAKSVPPTDIAKNLREIITFEPYHLTHQYSPVGNVDSEFIDQNFKLNKSDPSRLFSIKASKWLRAAQNDDTWLKRLLQLLTVEVQNKHLPYSLRIRLVSELALSEITGVNHLFRKLIQDDDHYNLILGIIGAGVSRDFEQIDQIGELLFHEQPIVNQAACMVLSKFNNKESLEKLAQGFLNSSDSAKIIIAEGLSLNETEGHQILRDGSEVNNSAVRRAAVFGISRIKEEWAQEILEKLSQDDLEWLVRIAAADALGLSDQETWKTPKPVVKIEKSQWLLNYAAEFGVGIESDKAAWDLVESALAKGTRQQKLAALNIYSKVPYKAYNLSTEITELLVIQDLTMNERAFNLLLSLQALGIKVKE